MNSKDGGRYIYDNGKMFIGNSRSETRSNNLKGVVRSDKEKYLNKGRSKVLFEIKKYHDLCQYDHLHDWGSKASLMEKKPLINFPFAKLYSEKLATKLLGADVFPSISIEGDEETEYFLNKVLMPDISFQPYMLSLAHDLALYTSGFMRFSLKGGAVVLERFHPNYCYPEFKEDGELESVEIKYVYEDKDEMDRVKNKPKKKWFKMLLSSTVDIMYDNPEYDENASDEAEVQFQEVARAEHNLGYVQGEWFKMGENRDGPEGQEKPTIYDIRTFIDCFNRNISQSDNSVAYSVDPQLVLRGMTSEETDKLFHKSVSKAWNLGREGSAEYIELSGSGPEIAKRQREDYYQRMQDIMRIVMHDPEKMMGAAQSAKAMEILNGPLVENINNLRPWVKKHFNSLITKILVTVIKYRDMGMELKYTTPEGWYPKSMMIELTWPPIFSLTIQDMQQIVSIGVQVASGNIVSRDTVLRWMQAQGVDFGVVDFDLERYKVDNQKEFNSFF